jgi:hypothetical protein
VAGLEASAFEAFSAKMLARKVQILFCWDCSIRAGNRDRGPILRLHDREEQRHFDGSPHR